MKTLVIATNSIAANVLDAIRAQQHPRLEYLELAERLSADWLDYGHLSRAPLLRRLEAWLRLDFELAVRVLGKASRQFHDVLFSMSERVGIPLALAPGLRAKQVVVLNHPMSQLKIGLFKATGLHRRWRKVITLSHAEAEAFEKATGLPRDQLAVMNTPVDVDFYRPDQATDMPPEEPHCLTMGLSYRDYPTFIRAMRLLPDVIGHIRAGSSWIQGRSGYEQETLPPNIRTKPFVSPVVLRDLLRQCNFVVLPMRPVTQWTAGCTSLQLALAMGKAVIATRLPGLEDYVAHGESGLLVPANDPNALAMAIERLWRNPDEARRFGQRGRELMVTRFSMERWLDRMTSLLQSL